MSRYVHLNLINESEVLSSSPIRTQVIAPVVVALISLSTLAWWLFLYTNCSYLKRLNSSHAEMNKELQPGYKAVLDLNDQEKSLTALTGQLKAFKNAKICYGELFSTIPEHVEPNIQFTRLEVTAPPPPLFEKEKEALGPTNTVEQTGFQITGRTTGSNAVEAVECLLNALKADSYTNLIRSAQIPVNSIRPESASRKDEKTFLRFDIKCECQARRFE